MSDSSQGPGWWLASDGKWYPPQSAATPVPPPPPPPLTGSVPSHPQGSGAASPPPPPPWPAGGGQPSAFTTGTAGRGTNGFAIAALVLGILWLCGAGSLLALIFGIVALSQIKRTGQGGKGMAIAGIVLGAVGLVAVVLSVIALRAASDEIVSNQPDEFDDVSIVDCRRDELGRGVAELEITNDSSKESVYFVTVQFRAAGSNRVLSTSVDPVGSVEPGETVEIDAVTDERIEAERIECEIDFVERLASG